MEQLLDDIEKQISLLPEDSSLWHKKGELYVALNEPQKAALAWIKALEINPKQHDSAWALAQLFDRIGRLDEAIKILIQIYQRDPYYPGLLQSLAHKFNKAGARKKSEQITRKLLKRNPEDGNLWNLFGTLQRAKGCWKKARICYYKALKFDKTSPYPFINLSEVGIALKNYDEARLLARQGLKHFPESFELGFTLAVIELYRKAFAKAWVFYENRFGV
ncbi:MAG: tetratricopeptide repeat protein, partial [Pseudomonadota bacterium]